MINYEDSRWTILAETKDYILTEKNNVYRLHYYSDEDRCRTENIKSLISKDINKIMKRIEVNNEI